MCGFKTHMPGIYTSGGVESLWKHRKATTSLKTPTAFPLCAWQPSQEKRCFQVNLLAQKWARQVGSHGTLTHCLV